MLLTAIKEHGYAGRRIKIGQDYEVRDVKDSLVLRMAGLAKSAKSKEPVREPQLSSHARAAATRSQERREEADKHVTVLTKEEADKQWSDLTGGIVDEAPTREKTPISPEDKPRKRRRKYNRHDMEPE